MTLGNKIKTRRKELGMSQTELAQKTGYADKSAISKIEHGLVELGQSGILKFADALEIDYHYLMDWTDENGKEKKTPEVTEEDLKLIRAYQAAPTYIQQAVRDLLHISEKEPDSKSSKVV